MSFLLELDTCRALLKGNRLVHSQFLQYQGRLFVSAVTILEMELWLLHRNTPARHQFVYGAMRNDLQVLGVDDGVAHVAARTGARQAAAGKRLALTDLLITATAAVHGLTLVTHRRPTLFTHVPGLAVVDWLAP